MRVANVLVIVAVLSVGALQDKELQRERIEGLSQTLKEIEGALDAAQIRILQLFIDSMQADLTGDVEKRVDLLEKVYELSKQEYETKGFSTLWRYYGSDYSGIPLTIANVMRDSDEYEPAEKLPMLEKQEARSGDPRIASMIVEIIRSTASLESAIDRASEFAKQYPDRAVYRAELVRLLLEYQLDLIVRAHRDRGLPTDNPGNWDYDIVPHEQTQIAIDEARGAIEDDPRSFQQSFFAIFRNALQDNLAHCDQVSSFFEFGLDRMKESGEFDEAALKGIQEEIDLAMEKYCSKEQASTSEPMANGVR